MPATVEEIAGDVLEGFCAADADYTRISGGWRLHTAPEYFATVKIAEHIANKDDLYVTLEQNAKDAICWSGGKLGQGVENALSPQDRFDIAVWGPGNQGIKGVVEVKLGTWFTYSNVEVDVRRVCEALERAPNLGWGMSVYYSACWTEVSKTGEARLLERNSNITKSANAYASSRGTRCRSIPGKPCPVGDWNGLEGGCGCAVVLLFERAAR